MTADLIVLAACVVLVNRRTHSVHHTESEAWQAARDLAFLMNGVPVGYAFFIVQRLGKWAFFSARTTA